jgi:hydrogenase/urease accessory protein HupE
MNSNNNINDIIKNLFTGDDKYITGLLIILANVIGFVAHFKKINYKPVVYYGILAMVILLGSLLAHL